MRGEIGQPMTDLRYLKQWACRVALSSFFFLSRKRKVVLVNKVGN